MSSRFDVLDAAIDLAIETHDLTSLERAADDVMSVFRHNGFRTIDGDDARQRGIYFDRILRGIALKMYGDKNKAGSFASGYLFFRSADGTSLAPLSSDDVAVWEAGRAANPEYAKHLAAVAAADAALRSKFGVDTYTTRKGWIYWTKQYSRAFAP